jgi:hypothetical protein
MQCKCGKELTGWYVDDDGTFHSISDEGQFLAANEEDVYDYIGDKVPDHNVYLTVDTETITHELAHPGFCGAPQ